jgi:LacI family transcriptional regulator
VTQNNGGVRLKDLAERLNLSVPTVSRALAGHADIAVATRHLVRKTAREMNYRPNVHAQNLATRAISIHSILILGVPNVLRSLSLNSYYSEIMRAFCDTLDTRSYRFILAAESDTGDEFIDYHKLVRDHAAAGAVILDFKQDDERVADLQRAEIPFVVLGEFEPQSNRECAVWTDNVKGAILATGHLLEIGRKRVAMIGGLPGQMVSLSRIEGYRQALAQAGIQFDENMLAEATGIDERGGCEAMLDLLDRNDDIDGVFCASDVRSIGALKALRDRGLEVPEDVSLVGYDDLPVASYIHPTLTTIRQPTYEVGVFAMDHLEKMMRGVTIAEHKKVFSPELVVRASA